MSEKLKQNELKATLARAETELQETLARAQALREWITATRKLCGRKVQTGPLPVEPGVTPMPRRRTKGTELANRVAGILQSAGRPMHVRDIVAELEKGENPLKARNPVATVAVLLSRRPELFLKVSPNTFELIKKIEVNVAS